MQIFPDQNVQRHSVMSLETARSLANGPIGGGAEGEFPGNCTVSYLSLAMVLPNMLPLFSIMTLWVQLYSQ